MSQSHKRSIYEFMNNIKSKVVKAIENNIYNVRLSVAVTTAVFFSFRLVIHESTSVCHRFLSEIFCLCIFVHMCIAVSNKVVYSQILLLVKLILGLHFTSNSYVIHFFLGTIHFHTFDETIILHLKLNLAYTQNIFFELRVLYNLIDIDLYNKL